VISLAVAPQFQILFLRCCRLADFCPLGCYRSIKNINLHAKFSQKSLILRKKVNLHYSLKKKLIVSKNTILQNLGSKRFDYSLKLFFSNFLWAQIG